MKNRWLASRVLMMPRDTNPAGTIFGGVILSYIDQAGAEGARLAGANRVVTVSMREVTFHEPVYVGDVVTCYAEVVAVGNSSVTVRVLVEAARRDHRADVAKVTEAEIVYVNVDEKGRPVPIQHTTDTATVEIPER